MDSSYPFPDREFVSRSLTARNISHGLHEGRPRNIPCTSGHLWASAALLRPEDIDCRATFYRRQPLWWSQLHREDIAVETFPTDRNLASPVILRTHADTVTIRDAILTCARKPTRVSLIYRTEPTTKKCKNRRKNKKYKTDMPRNNSKQSGESM